MNDYNNLSSYQYCMDSDVIITMNSSLGFEFFGNGNKVLFCNTSDKEILNGFQEENLYDQIPNECLLFSKSYKELSNKIHGLLSMSENNYSLCIKNSPYFFMTYGERGAPLKRVQNYISNSLK